MGSFHLAVVAFHFSEHTVRDILPGCINFWTWKPFKSIATSERPVKCDFFVLHSAKKRGLERNESIVPMEGDWGLTVDR
jgi:hypothetical protein